jgi:hypothetical protein
MRTNLDTLFKNSADLENSGIWFSLTEKTRFLVKRFGGNNATAIKAAIAKHYKPYARLIELGSLSPDKEREIQNKVFVNSCMVDWEGVEIDGKITPFSKEVAVEFLNNLPELANTLIEMASDTKNFREELGNS